MSVYKKLLLARRELQSRTIKKSGKNSFAGYDYYELQDFITPIHEIMEAVGLMGWVTVTESISTLTVIDLDKADDMIVFTSPTGTAALKGCHDVQNRGAVITYQRRYLWMMAFEITEPDPLDRTHGKDEPPKKRSNGKATPDKLTIQMLDMIEKNGKLCYGERWTEQRAAIAAHLNVGSLSDIDTKQLQKVIDGIDKKLAEQVQ